MKWQKLISEIPLIGLKDGFLSVKVIPSIKCYLKDIVYLARLELDEIIAKDSYQRLMISYRKVLNESDENMLPQTN